MNEQDRVIGSFFDDCARTGIMGSFDESELAKLASHLDRWGIRPGDRILEPGCGSGRMTALLAGQVGPEGEVVSCDLSGEMIECAKRRDLPPWVHLHHGSVMEMSFRDGFFDMVICFQVFPHFTDRAGALAKFHRILKPGGTLWIVHLSSRDDINTLHRNSSDAIISHMIPEEPTMRKLLNAAEFDICSMHDTSECYWIQAMRE